MGEGSQRGKLPVIRLKGPGDIMYSMATIVYGFNEVYFKS